MSVKTPENPLRLVEKFNRQGKQLVRTSPELDVPERDFRFELIREEVHELVDAFSERDFIEVIDACADITYVVCGAALTHGVGMEVRRRDPLFPVTFETGHILGEAISSRFKDLLLELSCAETLDQMVVVWEELVEACYTTSSTFGVDLDVVIAEVQASNMSKFLDDGTPLLRDDGKIMKGPNYFKPNIPQVLRDMGMNV